MFLKKPAGGRSIWAISGIRRRTGRAPVGASRHTRCTCQSSLERSDDHRHNNHNQKDSWYLVHYSVVPSRPDILSACELLPATAAPMMEPSHCQDGCSFGPGPDLGPIHQARRQDQDQSKCPGRNHRRIHYDAKQLALHSLEKLVPRHIRSDILRMIDKESRKVEQPCHPCDDRDDM